MRANEIRTFDERHEILDCADPEQLALWSARYQIQADDLRKVCAEVGGHRMHVELKLSAPRA